MQQQTLCATECFTILFTENSVYCEPAQSGRGVEWVSTATATGRENSPETMPLFHPFPTFSLTLAILFFINNHNSYLLMGSISF